MINKVSFPSLVLVVTLLGYTSLLFAEADYRYLTEGRNYTFAIYNNTNQLITYPIEDWLNRTKEMDRQSNPYTDVFVISHGWNFTVLEAISNYNSYINTIENYIPRSKSESFRPYFIFIVWDSVSRPLTSASRSILPYGISDFVELPVKIIDSVFFHIPSGWKESINAYHNALGRDLPVFYMVNENNREKEYKYGRDVPVSEILYKILSKKEERRKKKEESGKIKPKIHVIGHSYGAKLIALATLAALDKYEAKTNSNPSNYFESIILFNAAFHPSELNYLYRSFGSFLANSSADKPTPLFTDKDIEHHFKKIPRKAIIFSNSDYATGFLYGIGQIILNSRHTQYVDSELKHQIGNKGLFASYPEWLRTYIGIPISGGLQLSWNVVTAVGEWSLRSIIQFPTEWLHHVENNDTFGNNPLSKILNSVHYFIPLDKLLNKDVDQQGIFRTTFPALGRSGLHNNVRGHLRSNSPVLTDLGGFRNFVFDEDGNQRTETVIDSNAFAKMACDINWEKGFNFHNPNLMYSFDASAVFDTKLSLSGSHGDIRSSDEIAYCVQNKLSGKAPQKIEGAFNFVLKFINGFKAIE